VVARLTERGHEVLCLSRRPLAQPTIAGLAWARPVRTLPCDLSDPTSVEAARAELCQAEAVVHLAACVPEDTARNSLEDADATLRHNVVATARLLSALGSSKKLRCLVYASTFEVYGAPQRQPVDEQHPTQPLGYYGASKLTGEKYVGVFAAGACRRASLRMPAITVRGTSLAAIGNFIRAAAARRARDPRR
jgi:UDP-glucose 4-epimerase